MSAPDSSPIFSSFSDDADMVELIQEFVGNLKQRVAAIHTAAEADDMAELSRLAHQLKGSSGGYGFDMIGHAAAQLESVVHSAACAAEVREQLDELVVLCHRATAVPS